MIQNGKKLILLMTLILVASACHFKARHDLKDALATANKGEYLLAAEKLDLIIARGPSEDIVLEATREAARLAFFEVKDFKRAARYYESLVLISTDADERIRSQKQVATIYFEHLADYSKAIIEINKILPLVRDTSEQLKCKMDLAKAYYYQNNFFQAEMEVDEFLLLSKNEEQNFQMKILKANIILARKEVGRAAELLKEIIKTNPEKAKKENVGLTLAVAYEEMKEYKKAIETLEDIKASRADQDYVNIRIKRLRERVLNQPGARGMRK